ncbi:MAG TPA: isochorismate synthase [Candidatus Binatia bacterium]|nr:isochorismate synthase [Candidatus Binatia bacterium]
MSRGAFALRAGATRVSAARALATASLPLPAAVDPLDLLRAVPSSRRFFWERRDAGVAIAGVGAAVVVDADGPDRFARVAAALGSLPPDVLLVGGFGFAPGRARSGPWARFGACTWLVPRVAVVRRPGEVRLVAAGAARAALSRALARARAALARPRPARRGSARFEAAPLRPTARWRAAVDATLADIAAGRLRKLVLARAARVRASVAFDAPRVLDRLRGTADGCTVFAVGVGPATFVGASPERLARVEGSLLTTAAVAGTAARGDGAEASRRLAAALLGSAKERAEHAHVVDDVRARLRPLCAALDLPDAPAVRPADAVQHLVTPVEARLRPGTTLLDVVAALHPTPAICGTPREAALAVLRGREDLERGWYGGGVGWLDAQGGGEVTVAIRTALLDGPRALLHAGAGIVAGSSWARELEETRLKLRPMLGALLEL